MTQARGVFPLPQTSPQIAGVDEKVELGSGGIYYPPSGNYLVTTGGSTLLQWFDPIETMWRVMRPSQSYHTLNADGTNYRLVNFSGVVSGATVSAAGSAGTNGIGPMQTGTTVSFAPSPVGAPGQADGYVIIGGSVPAPTVVQGGTGFLVPPVVCCDPPPVGGRQATFTATISATGSITAVTVVDGGAGYTSPPQFYVIPQFKFYPGMPRWPGDVVQTWPAPGTINPLNVWPGTLYQPNIVQSGALIMSNPLTGSGTVTGIVLDYYGAGYTAAAVPAITFAGGPLTGAAATAQLALSAVASGTPPVIALGGTSTIGQVVTIPGTVPAVLTAVDTAGNFAVTSPGLGISPGAIASNGQAVPAAALGGANDVSYLQAKVN